LIQASSFFSSSLAFVILSSLFIDLDFYTSTSDYSDQRREMLRSVRDFRWSKLAFTLSFFCSFYDWQVWKLIKSFENNLRKHRIINLKHFEKCLIHMNSVWNVAHKDLLLSICCLFKKSL
jgi:hypothetical protein